MAIIDEIEKTEQGIAKARALAPGLESYQKPVIQPAQRQAISAQPVAPRRSLGTQFGSQVRRNINTELGVAEGVANLSVAPVRKLGGFARDVSTGFTGAPNPREGRPLAAHFDLPRLGTPQAPTTPAAQVTAHPVARRSQPVIVNDGSSGAPAMPYTRPPALAGPSVGNAANDRGLPAGISRTLDDAGNTVYSGTGASVAAAGGAPAGSTVVSPRTLPPQVAAPDNPTRHETVGRQGVVIGNPGGPEAGIYGGEAERRFQNAIGSLLFSPGDTRSKRALTGQAIDALSSSYNQARGAENQSALAGQNAEAVANLQAQRNIADANEAFAGRRLDASKFNVGADLQARDLEAKQRAPFEQQPILRSLDGGTSVLRRDGSISGLTNSDGTPFRLLDPSQRTTVSPDAEFKALSDELTALAQVPGEDGGARASQIQARMVELTGKVPSAPAIGTIQGGHRFKGGDPTIPTNWERVD